MTDRNGMRGGGQSQADQEYDARRYAKPSRRWYNQAPWQRIRLAQLAAEPLCRMCLAADPDGATPATVVDHVNPHREDHAAFHAGPFQSLCASCHSRHKQRQEQAGYAQRGVWD